MQADPISGLVSQALWLCVWLSLPAIAVSAVVGLLVSLFQAVTSLQDSSVSQAVKLIAVGVTILVTAPWGSQLIMSFADVLIQAVFKS